MRSTRYLTAAVLLSLLPVVALWGCGGADSGTITAKVLEEERPGIPADAGQWMVEVETDPDGGTAYSVEEMVIPPGNTNFHLTNPQPTGHDFTVEEVGGGSSGTKVIREGDDWLRVSLYEGKRYVFYCSIPGHRKAGMRGTITVDPALGTSDLDAY
jgi:plastocyanin